jgi:hypothetical protein
MKKMVSSNVKKPVTPTMKTMAANTMARRTTNVGTVRKMATLPAGMSPIRDDYTSLKEAALIVQRIRISAQQELEMARKMRTDAQRYQMETATRARSEAQQLILKTRLATQRDIEDMIKKAADEIQKVLADIRVIRITAQEELAAQRKFADAAKLNNMSLALKNNLDKLPEVKRKKPIMAVK